MTEEKDRLSDPITCRLEFDQLDFIEDLERRRIFGWSKAAVIRRLIGYAMDDMAKTDFIQKSLAMRQAAKKD